jgi:hypothetical protein
LDISISFCYSAGKKEQYLKTCGMQRLSRSTRTKVTAATTIIVGSLSSASWEKPSTEFGLTVSLKQTNITAQDVSTTPTVVTGDHTLEVVDKFTYLGSTITNNLSLDVRAEHHSTR